MRAHIDDHSAVSRAHVVECHASAVHLPEVGDLGDPPERIGVRLPERLERADECDVDPQPDRSQLGLDLLCRGLHGAEVGDVRRNAEPAAAHGFDLPHCRLQPGAAASQHRDVPAAVSQLTNGRAADSGRPAGHHRDSTLGARRTHVLSAPYLSSFVITTPQRGQTRCVLIGQPGTRVS